MNGVGLLIMLAIGLAWLWILWPSLVEHTEKEEE